MTSRPHLSWFFALVALLLGLAAGYACAKAAGPSLGLFLGGVFFATLLTPPLTLAGTTLLHQLLHMALGVLGIAAMWIIFGVSEQGTSLWQCLHCILVLVVFSLCLGAVAVGLTALRLDPFVASGLTVVLGLLWLTWPIWLSPLLAGDAGPTLVNWLVPAHPILTINGILTGSGLRPDIGNWNEMSIAYHLTNLGNDLPYEMPRNAMWTVVVHGAVAALVFAACWWRGCLGNHAGRLKLK